MSPLRITIFAATLLAAILLLFYWAAGDPVPADAASTLSQIENESTFERDALVAATPEVVREHSEVEAAQAEPEGDTPVPLATEETAATPEPQADDLRIVVIDSSTSARSDEVPVHVAWLVERGNSRSVSQFFAGRPTGPDKEVRIPRATIEERAKSSRVEGRLRITARAAFDPELSLRLPIEPWPSEPIELVLPAYGWVRFRLHDEVGNFLAENAELAVSIYGKDHAVTDHEVTLTKGESQPVLCSPSVELKVRGTLNGGGKIKDLIARGPEQGGTTKWLDVRREGPPAMMVLRLVLRSGEPLTNAAVQTSREESRFTGGGSITTSSSDTLTTNEDGYLKWTLDDPSSGANLKRTMSMTHKHAELGDLAGLLEYSRSFPSGETYLGELTMQPEPLLASGRVVDAHGRAVADAAIAANLIDENPAQPFGETVTTTTDKEGRFLLRTVHPSVRLRLNASATGFGEVEPIEVRTGTEDLLITLDAEASLHGSIRMPEGMSPASVSLRIQRPGESRDTFGFPRTNPRIEESGEFHVARQAPGTTTVVFSLREAGHLLSVPDVQFVAGEENRDPRLQNIELCAGWRLMHLRVIDTGRRAIAQTALVLQSKDGRVRRNLKSDADGKASAWIPPEQQHFTMGAAGYRLLDFDWSGEPRELVLDAGIRVTLPVQVVLHPPIDELSFTLSSESQSSTVGKLINDRAEMVVGAAGRYQLVPHIMIRQSGASLTTEWELDPPVFFDVEDNGTQTLPTFTITPAMLEAALERK